MIKLSAIILNYNTKYYLENCIRSLELENIKQRNKEVEVIVVDNGSDDGSQDFVRKKFPWTKLIANKNNLGFAKANNLALKIAKGRLMVLLNSDTVVKEGVFKKVTDFMEKDATIGAVTPRLQLPDGSLDLACHRGLPTLWNSFTYFVGLERLFPESVIFSGYHQTWRDFNVAHEVEAISGACFFIKKAVLEKVGLLDENFFMYAEDLDWCARIRKAGWKIVYFPGATVIHYKKRSGRSKEHTNQTREHVKNLRSQTSAHFYDTMLLFYDKHYHKKYPAWFRPLVLSTIWILKTARSLRTKFL